MTWILLVLVYGLLKGAREIAKKLAMKKDTVMEVLVAYTVISFIFVIPQAPKVGGLEAKYFFFIAIKSFCIFLAWICSFNSLKHLPVSLYGILDLSKMLFATFLAVVFLGERMSVLQIIGLIIVCLGLVLLKFKPKFLRTEVAVDGEENQTSTVFIILAFVSCLLNAVSGFLDKVLMKDITSSQLQFWYMLFLVSYYLIYILIKHIKLPSKVWKNGWTWLLAIMFVIGDKALFIANGMEGSRITVMTLVKQSGCLVTILGGKFIFKEKNTGYRLFCAAVIILGIVLGVLK